MAGLKLFVAVDLLSAGLLTSSPSSKAKIVTFGAATTADKLWRSPVPMGLTDGQATAVNAAVVPGRQLVGKKAALRQGRGAVRFGAVAAEVSTSVVSELKKNAATLKAVQIRILQGSRAIP
jgi:hypothetical protein